MCINKIKKPKALCFRLFIFGAGNEVRTRDLNLGKVALYQLSYSRTFKTSVFSIKPTKKTGGANQSRTGLNGFAGRGITALLSRHYISAL
jgi:hypothetical protein